MGNHSYLTGFYTSRPALKGYVRSTNNFLQVVKQLDVLAQLGPDYSKVQIDALSKYKSYGVLFLIFQQANGSKVNLFYSTPSCYAYALNKAGKTWPTKTDDFFPIASRNHSFWSGYFTSRPALKGYVRSTNNFLQVVKQLDVLAQLGAEYSKLQIDVLSK